MRRGKKEKKPALILRVIRHYGFNPGRVASEILEWLEVLVVAGLLAFLVISFVTVRMHVPTDSMYPTINGDPSALRADSFFVDKVSYYFRNPKPGDIVVFWHTEAVLINRLATGSKAERAGITPGDRLITINRGQSSRLQRPTKSSLRFLWRVRSSSVFSGSRRSSWGKRLLNRCHW